MKIDRAKSAVIDLIDQSMPKLWALSLDLHRHPEIGFEEHRASRKISDFLEAQGFTVERGVANLSTAFQAKRSAKRKGKPIVSFLAEYDALPGLGHACGHNLIATASAGAGTALASAIPAETGGVVVFGTPAEEGGGGKVIMAKNDYFRDVDVSMMVHPAGETRAEVDFLALAELRFHFQGKPAHASASPEQGINALDGIIATFNAISALRQHLPSEDRVHGIITNGGEAPNIVPAKASAWFYVRSDTTDGLETIVKKVVNCARGAARATGTRLRVQRNPITYDPMRVNTALASLFRDNLAQLGIQEPNPLPPLAKGSSDVGNVSQQTPTIHPQIQMVPPDVSAHTPAFAKAAGGLSGKKTLILGAKALAMTGVDILLDEKARNRVKAEFHSQNSSPKNAPKKRK